MPVRRRLPVGSGTSGEPSSEGDTRRSRARAGLAGLIDNPWVILGLLFLVMAAFGIPLLWMSRAFSTFSKVLLTILVSAYTVAILWGFWLVLVWCYEQITGALG